MPSFVPRSALPQRSLLATALLAVQTSFAAEPPPATLDPVVVTATRTATTASQAPAAVTVITADDLAARDVTRPADALKAVPSLSTGANADGLVNRAAGGTGGITLRGIPGSRTLVLLDGQSLLGVNSGAINWRLINVDEIERIEVVPGSFSALYGSGAAAGVIDVMSKRPDRDELLMRWRHGSGDGAGDDLSLFARKRWDSGLGLQLSLSRLDRDDYANEAVVISPVSGSAGTPATGALPTGSPTGTPGQIVGFKGPSPWTQDNASLRLSYDINARHRVHAGLMASRFSETPQGYRSLLANASGAPVASGTLGINGQRYTLTESQFVNTVSSQRTRRIVAGWEAELEEGATFQLDAAHLADDPGSQVITSGAAVANGAGRHTLTPSQASDLRAQYSRSLPGGHQWTAGASLRHESVAQRHWALANWRDTGSATALNEGYDGRSDTAALFGLLQWKWSDALDLHAGGRWDHWRTRGSYFRLNAAPATHERYAERDRSAFSPKLSAVYRLDGATTLRASAGRSFLAPGNLDLYARSFHGPAVFMNDPALKPERGTSAELGLVRQLGRTASVSATLYQSRLTDMIAVQRISSTLRQTVNIGQARVRGLELSGQWAVLPGLKLNANASLVDARTVSNEADPASVGKRLTNVPRQQAYLGLVGQRGGWSGSVDLRHVGKVYANSANDDVVQRVPGSHDAYTWANASLGYRFSERLKLQLSVNNLFDRVVYQSIRMPGRNIATELVFSL